MHTQNNRIFKALALLFLFILLVINSRHITNSIRTNFSDLSASPLKAARNFFCAIKKIIPFASLRDENRILREELELLDKRLQEAGSVFDENERLKEILGFRKSVPYTTVPAQVIGRDPSNWSNSLIIDKGIAGGVKQNKAVLSSKGLVGRVVEAGRFSSKILLITDPNSKVGVVVQRNREGGVLTGRPDGLCRVIYLSLDSDVAPGDSVITAGFGSIFPKDIPVGEVVSVGREPGRLYKYAVVKPAQNLSKVEEVLCIR